MRLLLLLAWLAATSAGGDGVAGDGVAGDPVLVDRVVAVVDDDPILSSDIERVIALGLVEPEPGEEEKPLRRRVLDTLIANRLRLHEVERYETGRVSVEEVDRQVAKVRQQLGDELPEVLRRLGLDEEGLRHLLTRQLRVLVYIEERLGPRIFVDLDDIRGYYETELTAEMERQGTPLPPLAEVREAIRGLLRERRLNEEIAAWTEELRMAADIVDHFDRSMDDLPPVVLRLEGG